MRWPSKLKIRLWRVKFTSIGAQQIDAQMVLGTTVLRPAFVNVWKKYLKNFWIIRFDPIYVRQKNFWIDMITPPTFTRDPIRHNFVAARAKAREGARRVHALAHAEIVAWGHLEFIYIYISFLNILWYISIINICNVPTRFCPNCALVDVLTSLFVDAQLISPITNALVRAGRIYALLLASRLSDRALVDISKKGLGHCRKFQGQS